LDAIELAAVLVTLALLASMISVEVGVTVALIELTLGVVAGNVLHVESQDWLTLVAAFASIRVWLRT
jgi:Kef-type K+ transport system membrane component KefB